ncbi:hypothetical protein [Amycolatopsis sp. NPDC059021]|uniref:hypothetical protein n=1 Tax=Amycolatopsis sp. NPDC059021 TaxID=3346704 RepID=UPI00366ABB8B
MMRKLATGFGIALLAFGGAVSAAGTASASPVTAQSYKVVMMWAGTTDKQAEQCETYRAVILHGQGECMFYNGNTELRVPA